ncbi:F-box only protein 36-like [Vipera latastei]
MSSLLQEKLCEVQIQAPAPQKDFHYFTITKTEVIWRSWQITYRPNQEKIFPKELKKTHRDFLLDEHLHSKANAAAADPGVAILTKNRKKSMNLHYIAVTIIHNLISVYSYSTCAKSFPPLYLLHSEHVQSIFGKNMLKYTLNLCQGHYDFLVRMPENLIVHIMSFLNMEDIKQLSKTCKRFQQLCNTDEFWERIKKLQDKFTLDLQSAKFPAYEKERNFHQRKGYLTQMQRRHTTFF